MAKSSAQVIKSLSAANRKPNPVGGTNRDIKSLTFKKANGGLISETNRNSGDGPYQEPDVTIHPSTSHAAQHLKNMFGDKSKAGTEDK